MKSKIIITLSVGALLLSGCGGSGSSSTNNGLSFPSNAIDAKPTIENAKKVRDVVATNQTNGGTMLNSVEDESKLNITLISKKIVSKVIKLNKKLDLDTYALNETVNETYPCKNGGTVHYSGSGEDEVGGTLTLKLQGCTINNLQMTGSLYMTIAEFSREMDDFKKISVKYLTDFKLKDLGGSSVITILKNGFQNMDISKYDSSGEIENFKMFMTVQATNGSKKYGQKDTLFYVSKRGNQTVLYQTKGRVYIDNLASYVDYDTSYDMSKTPFVFVDKLESGESRFNMLGKGKVKIIIEYNEVKTYIDADGDGVFEEHD